MPKSLFFLDTSPKPPLRRFSFAQNPSLLPLHHSISVI
uniref:Uncharacterized protein n=1 Tax=Podoviridae sp. ct9R41 TaxID=2825227 RepID=A0A8S5P837_9CAUD|nr:MAG TPA: hypothetical protein [Podoviridae sp. ct9R41]